MHSNDLEHLPAHPTYALKTETCLCRVFGDGGAETRINSDHCPIAEHRIEGLVEEVSKHYGKPFDAIPPWDIQGYFWESDRKADWKFLEREYPLRLTFRD